MWESVIGMSIFHYQIASTASEAQPLLSTPLVERRNFKMWADHADGVQGMMVLFCGYHALTTDGSRNEQTPVTIRNDEWVSD